MFPKDHPQNRGQIPGVGIRLFAIGLLIVLACRQALALPHNERVDSLLIFKRGFSFEGAGNFSLC
jgi:hypothetical protein